MNVKPITEYQSVFQGLDRYLDTAYKNKKKPRIFSEKKIRRQRSVGELQF